MVSWWIPAAIAGGAFITSVCLAPLVISESRGANFYGGILVVVALLSVAFFVINLGFCVSGWLHEQGAKAQTEVAANWDKAKAAGLMGPIAVLDMQSVPNVSGSVHGSSFFAVGNVDGTISTDSTVLFWWQATNGDIVPCELPVLIFTIKIDDSLDTPTVVFDWVKTTQYNDYFKDFDAADTEHYSYYINKQCIKHVVLRMSQADFDCGVFVQSNPNTKSASQ